MPQVPLALRENLESRARLVQLALKARKVLLV